MGTIRKLEPGKPMLPRRKRAAAYCRVSRETERLLHSLSAQVSYYSALIQKNPEWEYAGVYVDEGISGTGTAARSEFQRLLADCEAGRVDIILTKSVSRFARNTVDLLETVRRLKTIGVEVRFEEQNISTLGNDGELMLTILASFAQEESVSQSRNIRWSKQKTAEKGEMTNTSVPYGYRYDKEAGGPVIIPEQAEVVRMIFRDYTVDGLTVYDITEKLNASNVPAQRGEHWQACTVRRMLRNINYTGNMLLGKYYSQDALNHRRIKNAGEQPMYFVEDSHQAIIDRETYDKAQAELDRCSALGRLANPNITCNHYTGKIICRGCGRPFGRCVNKMRGGTRIPVWSCKKPGGKCMTPGILESELDGMLAEQLGLAAFDPDRFSEQIDRIEVGLDDIITFFFRDGRVTTRQFIRRKKSPLMTRRKADG